MKRFSRGGPGAWAASAVVVLGGCTTLLGIDKDYQLVDGGAGSGSGASSSGTGGAGAPGVGTLGETCGEKGQLACAGNAQSLTLICETDHTWHKNETCAADTLCDTTVYPGTCRPVVAACVGKAPGDVFCAGSARVECGPDLVTGVVETCPYLCSAGKCEGACVPLIDKQCVGNMPQSCDGTGEWKDGATCPGYCAGGNCIDAPNCAILPATCGPGKNENCCVSSSLPAGTYDRSNDPAFPATVSAFRLDRFEITVGRFRQFVAGYPGTKPAAGAGAHPLIAGGGWQVGWDASLPADQAALKNALKCDPVGQTWTDDVGGNENKPVGCLDWYEAFSFCAWDGGRLPTEAEWNYAATGGDEQRYYPWGAAGLDAAHAVYDCTGDGSAAGQCDPTDILNVGSRSAIGDGKWGQADLAGSMAEWVLDWYDGPYAAQSCKDCAAVSKGTASKRVVRGGGWNFPALYLPSSFRDHGDPTLVFYSVGARCARTP